MSKKFVRSIKDVNDVSKVSKSLIEENDIISTVDGKVYIVTKTGFIEVIAGVDKQEITNLKSEIKKLKNRVETLESK